MKTLHFYTEYYYPAENSTSFYLTKIIDTAAQAWNGRIIINCASANNGPELLADDNIIIRRFPEGNIDKNNLWKRLWKFGILTLKMSYSALNKIKKNDVVFSVTNPAFLLLAMALLRKFKKFHWILLVYDVFPEVLIPGGLTNENSLKYRLSLKLFNYAYRSADEIIVIGRDMQDIIRQKTSNPNQITLIPNWSDIKNIYLEKDVQNSILRRYQITNKYVFTVAGNIGRTQGMDNYLKAIKLVKSKEIFYLFIGGGAKKNQIDEFISKNPDINILTTGILPSSDQNSLLNACDIAVISLTEGMYGLSVPSKSYFNMAAGKPLLYIGDKNSEIALIIKEYNIGWVVPPGNIELLADTIENISKYPKSKLNEIGLRSREIAETMFSEDIVLKKYKSLFQSLN